MKKNMSSKRPREEESPVVSGEALQTIVLQDQKLAAAVPITSSFETLVYPMQPAEFMQQHYGKKAVAVTLPTGGGGSNVKASAAAKRLSTIKSMLSDFHPLKMLENSASDAIHVWLKTRSGELKSMQTDATSAFNCYQAGHSLYFRTDEHTENAFLRSVADGMGYGKVFGCYPDGKNRAEIETFVSHIGHTTPWHFDYMENFTIQLRGAKKWSLIKADVPHPFRSCATHFPEHTQVLHDQFKLHKADTPTFKGVPENADAICEAVTLYPGDVLYHPAGWWHKVEAVGNSDNAASLSINLSFMPLSWMQLLLEGLQHSMVSSALFREGIVARSAHEGRQQAASRLKALAQMVEALNLEDFFPENCEYSESPKPIRYFELNEKGEVAEADGVPSKTVQSILSSSLTTCRSKGSLRRNPLSVLFLTEDYHANVVKKTNRKEEAKDDSQACDDSECDDSDCEGDHDDDDEEEDEGGAEYEAPKGYLRYDIHTNFGNEDIASRSTVAIFVSPKAKAVLDVLNTLALVGPNATVSDKIYAIIPKETDLDLYGILVYAGYLN